MMTLKGTPLVLFLITTIVHAVDRLRIQCLALLRSRSGSGSRWSVLVGLDAGRRAAGAILRPILTVSR